MVERCRNAEIGTLVCLVRGGKGDHLFESRDS
jgi:hypothetical protein